MLRRLAPVCLLAGFLPFADVLLAQPPAAKPRKVALLVGGGKYDHAFTDLGGVPERDVTELAKTLGEGGFEVVVLTGSTAGADRATKANIESRVKELTAGKSPLKTGDTLLVGLCGHGVQEKPAGEKDDQPFFCPVDARPNDTATMVPLNALIAAAEPTGATALFLVDACRELPADPNRSRSGIQGTKVNLPARTAVLFSCGQGQLAHQNDTLGGGHGLFTFAVLKAFRGGGGAKTVHWSRLVADVQETFRSKEILDLIPPGKAQTPKVATGEFDDIPVTTAAAPPPGEVAVRPSAARTAEVKTLLDGVAVSAAAVSGDGKRLAVLGSANTVHLFDLPAGRAAETLAAPGAQTVYLADDGKWLVVGQAAEISVWNLAEGKPGSRQKKATLKHNYQSWGYGSVAVNSDGSLLAATLSKAEQAWTTDGRPTGKQASVLWVWSLEKPDAAVKAVSGNGHSDGVWTAAFAGPELVVMQNGQAFRYNSADSFTKEEIVPTPANRRGHVWPDAAGVATPGRYVVWHDKNKVTAEALDAKLKRTEFSFEVLPVGQFRDRVVQRVAVTPDGSVVVAAGTPTDARAGDTYSTTLAVYRRNGASAEFVGTVPGAIRQYPGQLLVTPDGTQAVVLGDRVVNLVTLPAK